MFFFISSQIVTDNQSQNGSSHFEILTKIGTLFIIECNRNGILWSVHSDGGDVYLCVYGRWGGGDVTVMTNTFSYVLPVVGTGVVE